MSNITAQLQELITTIGASTFASGEQLLPCIAHFHDGTVADFAAIRLNDTAPASKYYDDYKSVRQLGELSHIGPSPHALSLALREACSRAEEVRMGFYPTIALGKAGQKVVINGHALFAEVYGQEACNLLPAHEPYRQGYPNYLFASSIQPATLVLAHPV